MVAWDSSKTHHKRHGRTYRKAGEANKSESIKFKEAKNPITDRCDCIIARHKKMGVQLHTASS